MTLFDDDPMEPDALPERRHDVEGDPAGRTGIGDDPVRVRMTVAYDGRRFRGIWPNEGVRTVGDTLATSIERMLGHPVHLAVAGRTDAGVHAHGQVVSFDARREDLDLPKLQRAVNSMCSPEVVVREISEASGDFDARHSATRRHYRYTILNRAVPDPFSAATAWHITDSLDLRAMRAACDPFLGEHDFSSFCRRPKRSPDLSLSRRVLDARWHDLGDDMLRFDIAATAFCHQMVRSIVGTLVDVGRGDLRAGDITGIIAARTRQAAADMAPAHGLTLWQVDYDNG